MKRRVRVAVRADRRALRLSLGEIGKEVGPMKPSRTRFAHLGLIGALAIIAGCGSGDAPGRGSDNRAGKEATPNTCGPAPPTFAARAETPKPSVAIEKVPASQADPERDRYLRAAQANRAAERSLVEKLGLPISMSFADETPLEDVLKYIMQATATPTSSGIHIYVDPMGLLEAGREPTSTIQINMEGVPLKTTLKTALNSIGLTYEIDEMILVVTSKDSRKQTPPSKPAWPSDPATRAILAELEQVVPMSISEETPLGDVLDHIRTKTRSTRLPDGIPIEMDSLLSKDEAQFRMEKVQLDLEGAPLRLSLEYLLSQVGLTYVVSIGKIRLVLN
jgi:hypothetical protein